MTVRTPPEVPTVGLTDDAEDEDRDRELQLQIQMAEHAKRAVEHAGKVAELRLQLLKRKRQ